MNAFISKIRDTMMRWGRSTAGFYRANRGIVISGLTVISILLIVWARLGFTIQISQFFAASPGPTVVINSSLPIKYGQTLSVSWSATGATTCNA
ncbi:MAG TPA: hypothetical protein VMU12_01780, partial [Candidatus Paceibacterota bacterium]|nr:hypothetical protein [Candidatus Paceibacterota bacterium]